MALGGALIAAVGCVTQPYVYKLDEFDRDAPDFNRELVDRNTVSICFGRLFASRAEVTALADAECDRFGKRAVPRGDGFGACPLLTPVEARYDCRAAAAAEPAAR